PSREALSSDMWQDLGTICIFNTRDGTVHRLRGHGGAVWALSFAHGSDAPRLVSAAWVWDAKAQRYQGELRLWDVNGMKPVAAAPAERLPAPKAAAPVGVSAWSIGDKASQTRVAVAGGDGRLLIWDAGSGEIADAKDGQGNTALAYLPD